MENVRIDRGRLWISLWKECCLCKTDLLSTGDPRTIHSLRGYVLAVQSGRDVEGLFDEFYFGDQVRVLLVVQLLVDLSIPMLNGRMVASTELFPKLWEGQLGVGSGEVHRDVSWARERTRALRPRNVCASDVVKLGYSLNNRRDRYIRWRGVKHSRQVFSCEAQGQPFVEEP